MMRGTIVKLVRSYGAAWGRIQPEGTDRALFFNTTSLPEDTDFAALEEGAEVSFDEEQDRANGTKAVNIQFVIPPQATGQEAEAGAGAVK